jgi:hypothetical protein
MKKNTQVIIEEIKDNFSHEYKPFSKFVDSGELWNICIDAVSDAKLMNNIVFCNDELKIPPVKVFLEVKRESIDELNDFEKKAVGAFWGFVFKSSLKYKSQKSISVRVINVKSATYFYNCDSCIHLYSRKNIKGEES